MPSRLVVVAAKHQAILLYFAEVDLQIDVLHLERFGSRTSTTTSLPGLPDGYVFVGVLLHPFSLPSLESPHLLLARPRLSSSNDQTMISSSQGKGLMMTHAGGSSARHRLLHRHTASLLSAAWARWTAKSFGDGTVFEKMRSVGFGVMQESR